MADAAACTYSSARSLRYSSLSNSMYTHFQCWTKEGAGFSELLRPQCSFPRIAQSFPTLLLQAYSLPLPAHFRFLGYFTLDSVTIAMLHALAAGAVKLEWCTRTNSLHRLEEQLCSRFVLSVCYPSPVEINFLLHRKRAAKRIRPMRKPVMQGGGPGRVRRLCPQSIALFSKGRLYA